MPVWDRDILLWLNAFVSRHPAFDRLVVQIAFNDLFKGAFAMAILCWAFASLGGPDERLRRRRLLSLFLCVAPALAANRVLASLLPFRQRPLHREELGFQVPEALHHKPFSDLSAFPSDHALMFLSFALGLLLIRARLGLLLLLHALLIVLLPRLYLGLHWPSDLLAGAALAVLTVACSEGVARRARWFAALQGLIEARPGPATFLLSLLAFGYATLFDPVVRFARFLTS